MNSYSITSDQWEGTELERTPLFGRPNLYIRISQTHLRAERKRRRNPGDLMALIERQVDELMKGSK